MHIFVFIYLIMNHQDTQNQTMMKKPTILVHKTDESLIARRGPVTKASFSQLTSQKV